eukprot:2122674-Ditylum_brightwellii.AAC.1
MNPTIGVAMIRGTDFCLSGIVKVPLSWKDDDGKTHSYVLETALYFPESLVNILSITCLGKQLEDEEGTHITTKWKCTKFVWDHGKSQ